MIDDAIRADECAACSSCSRSSGLTRRDFLRDGFAAAFTALATLGFVGRAEAVPIRWSESRSAQGDLRSYGIPDADGAEIDRSNEVILVRWQNSVYAFNLSCPHQHTALRWEERAQQFQCPKHHSHYRPDGTFISGRATRGMDRFAVARGGEGLQVDLSRLFKQDDDPAGWSSAVLHL